MKISYISLSAAREIGGREAEIIAILSKIVGFVYFSNLN